MKAWHTNPKQRNPIPNNPRTLFVPSFSTRYSKKHNNLSLIKFIIINMHKKNTTPEKVNLYLKRNSPKPNFSPRYATNCNNTAVKRMVVNSVASLIFFD